MTSDSITEQAARAIEDGPMADDYTPSINALRADYIALHTRNFDSYMTGRSLTSEQEHYGREFDAALAAHDAEVAAQARADERAVVNEVWELVAEWERVARAGEASEIPQRMSVDFAVYALRRRLITARTPDPNGDNT